MTAEIYQLELQRRGFTFNTAANKWVGPHGITVSGYLNSDDQITSPGRAIDNGYARVSTLLVVDEQIRARSGQSRPPLVKPINEYSPDYQPYQYIMPAS